MKRFTCRTRAALVTACLSAALMTGTSTLAGSPTCSGVLNIATHGQHVVGDYVTGAGHEGLTWPPAGMVGEALKGKGAFLPGGPGPGFHFSLGVAAGASFCIAKAQSPGFHVP